MGCCCGVCFCTTDFSLTAVSGSFCVETSTCVVGFADDEATLLSGREGSLQPDFLGSGGGGGGGGGGIGSFFCVFFVLLVFVIAPELGDNGRVCSSRICLAVRLVEVEGCLFLSLERLLSLFCSAAFCA